MIDLYYFGLDAIVHIHCSTKLLLLDKNVHTFRIIKHTFDITFNCTHDSLNPSLLTRIETTLFQKEKIPSSIHERRRLATLCNESRDPQRAFIVPSIKIASNCWSSEEKGKDVYKRTVKQERPSTATTSHERTYREKQKKVARAQNKAVAIFVRERLSPWYTPGSTREKETGGKDERSACRWIRAGKGLRRTSVADDDNVSTWFGSPVDIEPGEQRP